MFKYHKKLYLALIITFALLYLFVAFVSTLHAITFFQITNSMFLAILLGLAFETGQSAILFSILMTKNRNKLLPWVLMILITSLQVTANVFASFKFIELNPGNDWIYWYKSILIGVQTDNPELYKVIISWIAGGLLPVIALGMTALVSQQIQIMEEEIPESKKDTSAPGELEEIKSVDVSNYTEDISNQSETLDTSETPIQDISEEIVSTDENSSQIPIKLEYTGNIIDDVNIIDVKAIPKEN